MTRATAKNKFMILSATDEKLLLEYDYLLSVAGNLRVVDIRDAAEWFAVVSAEVTRRGIA